MLTLYEHPFALYCQKVLIAFNELGIAYDVLEEQRDFDRTDLAKLWPRGSIPVLVDGDRVIGETSIIIEHVAGARLVPFLCSNWLCARPGDRAAVHGGRQRRSAQAGHIRIRVTRAS